MKNTLIATIATVVLMGCGESQQSPPALESKPVAEAAQPKPATAKAPDISIYIATRTGNIEAVPAAKCCLTASMLPFLAAS